jgi:hypothetical protein
VKIGEEEEGKAKVLGCNGGMEIEKETEPLVLGSAAMAFAYSSDTMKNSLSKEEDVVVYWLFLRVFFIL